MFKVNRKDTQTTPKALTKAKVALKSYNIFQKKII